MKLCDSKIKNEYLKLDFTADNADESAYLDSKNMLMTKSSFKTRPGVAPTENPFYYSPSASALENTFTLTDFFVDVNGRPAQISVATELVNSTTLRYHMNAIFSDISRKTLYSISFTKNSSNQFFRPLTYVIYSGKKTKGGGIYFLTLLADQNDNRRVEIYEINASLTAWTKLSVNDYYIPTLFIDGHGDLYDMSVFEDTLDYKKTQFLEGCNLLSGNFDCYFSTDGSSYCFPLPEMPNKPKEIVCVLKFDSITYLEWHLNAENGYENEIDLLGNWVTAVYDASANNIYFRSLYDDGFALLYNGLENNLKISVRSTPNPEALKAAAFQSVCNAMGSSKSGSSSVTVFSGNIADSSAVYWINPENPLYFCENCRLHLPSDTQPDNRMLFLDNRLILFKDSSIFSAKVTSAEGYRIADIKNRVSGAKAVSFPSLSFTRQLTLPAKIEICSIANCGDEIYFCDNNRTVYRLSAALSLKRFDILLPFLPDNAAVYEGKFLTFKGNSCAAFVPNISEKYGAFNWTFPINIIASSNIGRQTVFFATDSDTNVCIFLIGGTTDRYFVTKNSVRTEVEENICAELSVGLLQSDTKLKLLKLVTKLKSNVPSVLEVFDRKIKITERHIKNERFTLNCVSRFNDLSLKLSFKECAELFSVGAEYRRLSKF